ncbi:MAG: hypothetical protein OXH31_05960 [Gammaproteobacteria bacterium]|nr:hypothetical protein [Gammaproteobacteria bacterium]
MDKDRFEKLRKFEQIGLVAALLALLLGGASLTILLILTLLNAI